MARVAGGGVVWDGVAPCDMGWDGVAPCGMECDLIMRPERETCE